MSIPDAFKVGRIAFSLWPKRRISKAAKMEANNYVRTLKAGEPAYSGINLPFKNVRRINPGEDWNTGGWDMFNQSFWLNYDGDRVEIKLKIAAGSGMILDNEIIEKLEP